MLVLVAHDHAVHEQTVEQWFTRVEVGAREHVERPLAHVGHEVARRVGTEQVEIGALAAWVLERVVDVVEARVRGVARLQLPQEPELLVVADVREVPDERGHQR